MYMDGGVTVGGSRDTDSCFSLGASLLSGVPHIGCGLAGYLQREHFLLSNWGAPLASCGSKNPVTPLPCFSWARCHQWPLSSHGITSNSNSYSFHNCLDGLQRQGVCIVHSMCGVPGSSGQCAPACYSCSRSKVGSWTSYDPSPWVAGLQPVCCWGWRAWVSE